MSNGAAAQNDWDDRDKKREAILKVLRRVLENPQDGKDAVGDDAKALALFKTYGPIDVPPDARAIFFSPGEKKRAEGSSVLIELPPDTTPKDISDDLLITYVLGNYQHW